MLKMLAVPGFAFLCKYLVQEVNVGKAHLLKILLITFSMLILCLFTLQDVLKKGTGGWRKVVAAFGEDILLENGEVDRPKLGQIVFTDPSKRQLLNRYINV